MTATVADIVDNPLNLEIKELEAAQVSRTVSDVDIACINGNYAADAGFSVSDALATESADSLAAQTYVNVVVVKEGNEESEKTKALVDAGFGDRLATMPQGLDTQLYKEFTEDGVEVSGGEAQKIAIARALYKDAPFIILDEPTAALDPIAEAEIYSRFGQIVTDKTAVYISHRLSSCRFCDEILVFDEGHIVEKGTHEELVSAGGKYAELWNAQAQYYMKQG